MEYKKEKEKSFHSFMTFHFWRKHLELLSLATRVLKKNPCIWMVSEVKDSSLASMRGRSHRSITDLHYWRRGCSVTGDPWRFFEFICRFKEKYRDFFMSMGLVVAWEVEVVNLSYF